MPNNETTFKWKFHRLGGLDQLTLRTSEELCHLGELDPKLWVALSCPASGLEFDQRVLNLIDSDNDGRIRVPEVVAAVEWTCARLNDAASMIDPPESMPLSLIKTDSEEGSRLLLSAKAVLQSLGKPEALELTEKDVTGAAAEAARNLFNGDGIIPAHESLDAEMRQFILSALAVVGGQQDASGQPGLNRELAESFIKYLNDWKNWKLKVCDAASPLGEDTPEAGELMRKLKDKIEDYFLRCDLASFAPQAVESLNTEDALSSVINHGLLDMAYLAELPLAHISADRPLSLKSGLNPAWQKDLGRFFHLTVPLRAEAEYLSRADWKKIKDNFSAYSGALAEKPSLSPVDVFYSSTMGIEELETERINQILNGDLPAKFSELLSRDEAAPGSSSEVAAVEKLVLFHRYLYRFLMNFVSFYDFYSERQAAFQTGILYLDSRGCHLCLPVGDVATHSTLAANSQICLIYCACRRRGKMGQDVPDDTLNIVVAITAGDSDLLMEGRNGVYVDNDGRDWDATIVKFISNPIGLTQAVWEPYKKVARLISDQINKLAGDKQNQLIAAAGQKISGTVTPAPTPVGITAAKPPFDIGKSVGIFAAIGLALGALGTAVASIARAFFALSWYEVPLVFVGLFVIISGPSVILAWLKLRKRTIGPLLEASGWAINSRLPVNLSLGHKLTNTAILPENAVRSFNDPLRPSRKWPWVIFAVLALAIGAVIGWSWMNPDDTTAVGAPATEIVAPPAEKPFD